MKSHPKPRNWTFFDKFNYYTPGVAGMFVLLGFLLIGAVLAIFILLLFKKQLERHKRRKHLKARIRRMKKRMEP